MFLNKLIMISVTLVIVWNATRADGEPTTTKYTYNSSALSYLSNSIQFPVPSAYSQGLVPGETTAETVAEMKWFSGLYDQHQWLKRVSNLENQKCRRDMEIYVKNLHNGTSWAAKMYDASGRYNGLLFLGNDYWMGSLTLCHELQNVNANVDYPPFPAYFYVAKVRININPILTPVTRQINVGQCLPKSCSVNDVRYLLIQEINQRASLNIVDVRPVPGDYSLLSDKKVKIVGGCGLVTLIIIITATVVEVLTKTRSNKIRPKDAEAENNNNGKNHYARSKEMIIVQEENAKKKKTNILLRLLLAFSAINNGRKIISVESTSKKDIDCLHGFRFFSIAWIILVHSYLEVFGVGRNKSYRTLSERSFMYQTIANASFSVDTFFFISGLLLTLVFFRTEAKKEQKPTKETTEKIVIVNLFKFLLMLLYRFIRLTPAYLFVLGANEIIMRYIHSHSVFTPAIIDHLTCDKYWWRNALYINNFFPQAEFCMLWSWYIANDTQFFIIASILLLIAIRGGKQLKLVAVSVGVLLVSSWLITFFIAMKYEYVARVEEPFALFDQLYDKPWMRIGPYLIGVLIGYMLFRMNGKVPLTPMIAVLGWILSLTCLGFLVYGLGKNGLVIPASAFYAALGHTAWGVSLAWMTVACASGYGGPFNTFFSWKMFLPLSRLTYGAYLVHPVLMCLTSFALDGSLQVHDVLMIVIFFGNLVLSFLCAFIISLGFETPAVNLLKIIFH